MRREADAGDRRRLHVVITDPGTQAVLANRSRREAWLAEAVAGCLSAEERAQLIAAGALLQRLAEYPAVARSWRLIAARDRPGKAGAAKTVRSVRFTGCCRPSSLERASCWNCGFCVFSSKYVEDVMREVPATEFARNFGLYREVAQREARGRHQPRPADGVFHFRGRV